MTTRTEALALYPTPAFVRGGEVVPVEGRRTLRVIDPATGHDLGEFPSATREDIEEALRLSERGFTAWRTLPVTDRAAILVLAADNLLARKARLAALVTLELGKPFREALAEVEVAAGMFRFAGEEARRSYGRQIPARESLTLQLTVREPVGPVAAFASWNAPLITPSRKISSALAAGCSVVLKASEQTPACAVEVARAVIDAGAPEGAVSVLFGEPQSIAGALLESPVIRAVTFTGSIPIGREIAARAAHSMKRQVMELGGHAPVIVFDDVDVEAVVASAVPAKYRNSGQVCTSPTRFIVQSGIYARFVEAFAARAAQVKIGDGFEPATDMGPLAHRGRIATTEDLVADARTRGLRIAAGGRRGEGPGCFYQPTVIADAGIEIGRAHV